MKPKTLMKIMLTMIPLMVMTKVNINSDFLTFSDFLEITPKYYSQDIYSTITTASSPAQRTYLVRKSRQPKHRRSPPRLSRQWETVEEQFGHLAGQLQLERV